MNWCVFLPISLVKAIVWQIVYQTRAKAFGVLRMLPNKLFIIGIARASSRFLQSLECLSGWMQICVLEGTGSHRECSIRGSSWCLSGDVFRVLGFRTHASRRAHA